MNRALQCDDVVERIAILCLRWPEPGRVKTRLIPELGAADAARCYERMANAIGSELGAIEIPGLSRWAYVAPGEQAEAWCGRLGSGWLPVPQPEGDLGLRLRYAVALAFAAGAQQVLIAGSDAPGLDRMLWQAAFDGLDDHDAVLGPALDGGYYLLGLRAELPALFESIPFSTDRVAAETLARLHAAGRRVLKLPVLCDVDRPEDLQRVEISRFFRRFD